MTLSLLSAHPQAADLVLNHALQPPTTASLGRVMFPKQYTSVTLYSFRVSPSTFASVNGQRLCYIKMKRNRRSVVLLRI